MVVRAYPNWPRSQHFSQNLIFNLSLNGPTELALIISEDHHRLELAQKYTIVFNAQESQMEQKRATPDLWKAMGL